MQMEHTSKSLTRLILLTVAIFSVGIIAVISGGFHYVVASDFLRQEIPFIIETKRMFASGCPLYSWNTHLGENFIATYSFYTLTSPFVWLICLFPIKHIFWGVLLSLYLKTICTSIFSYLYFKKMNLGSMLSCIGALLYTFSSFYVCNLFYFHFCEPIMLFPLLLIAIEDFINEDRKSAFKLALCTFVVVWVNYYFAISSLILGAIYFLFRSAGTGRFKWVLLFKAIGVVLIGIMAAAVVLIPTFFNLIGVPRAHITDDFGWGGIFEFLRLGRIYYLLFPCTTDFQKIFTGYDFSSTEAFIGFFGIFPVLIYAYKRRDWLGWLAITLIIMYLITPLNALFCLYSNSGYTRWIYGLILIGILATLRFTKSRMKPQWRYLIAYISLATIFLFMMLWMLFHTQQIPPKHIPELGLIALNFACLIIWACRKYDAKTLLWCVIICSCANMYLATMMCFDYPDRQFVNKDDIYNILQEYDGDLVLHENNYTHRTEFISSVSGHNLSMIINRPSLASFHSMFNKHVTPLRDLVAPVLSTSPFYYKMKHRVEFNTLTSVKEIYDYGNPNHYDEPYSIELIPIDTVGKVKRYDFPYYIKPGFSYDRYITESEINVAKDRSENIMLLMLDNLVINDSDDAELSKYISHGSVNHDVSIDSLVNQRRQTTCSHFSGNTRGFTASINLDRDQVIFFSVPADDGFTAKIDNKPVKIYKVNLGLSAIVVPAGRHDIKFSYYPPGLNTGLMLSILGIIMMAFLYFRWGNSPIQKGNHPDTECMKLC